MHFTLITFAIFCLGFISVAMFVRTDNEQANKLLSIGSAFVGSAILFYFLGTYFILNDMSFKIGYFEARRVAPILYERYQNFSVPSIIIFTFILMIYRRIFKGKEMFAAKKA